MTFGRANQLVAIGLPLVVGVVLAVAVRGHATADRLAVVLTGAYVAGMLLHRMRRVAAVRPTPSGSYQRDAVEPLAQLVRIERSVELSGASRLEYEHRLQPTLRYLAAERLRLRRGINIDRRPDAARAALGESAWDMVMRRGASSDRRAAAPTLAEIRLLFETLEQV
jgi:hypothetical protein